MNLKNRKIAVLKGGPGSERAVSLKSAESVIEALILLGAVVCDVDVTNAELKNGLLTIALKQELPEAMKPHTIPIGKPADKQIESRKAA